MSGATVWLYAALPNFSSARRRMVVIGIWYTLFDVISKLAFSQNSHFQTNVSAKFVATKCILFYYVLSLLVVQCVTAVNIKYALQARRPEQNNTQRSDRVVHNCKISGNALKQEHT